MRPLPPVRAILLAVLLGLQAACNGGEAREEQPQSSPGSEAVADPAELSAGASTVLSADDVSLADGASTPAWLLSVRLDPRMADTVHLGPPVLKIGETDGAAPYLFSIIAGGILLDDGGIAVADARSREVRLFDRSGRHIWTAGGRGDGPGEFQMLTSLHRIRGDTLVAFDLILSRITWLDADGMVLRTARLTDTEVRPENFIGQTADGDLLFYAITDPMPTGVVSVRRLTMVIERFDPMGRRQERVATIEGMKVFDFGPGDGTAYPFTPESNAAVLRDALFFANGDSPAVYSLQLDGGAARRDSITWNARPELAEVYWSSLDTTGNRGRDLSRLPKDERIPFVSGVLAAADALLIRPYQATLDARWSMRTGSGGVWWRIPLEPRQAMSAIRLPDGVRLLDYRDGRYLGLQYDELGVESLVVFQAAGPR